MNTTTTQLPTDQPVDLSLSRILFIDDQDLDAQILQALALLQQPKHYLRISLASELLAQLHQATWDLIVYGHCEALTLSQSLQHIQEAAVFRIPLLIALPQAPQSQDFAHFLSMIRHGVFDLLRLDQVDHIQASLLRALKYSYALQRAVQLQQQLKQMQKLNHLLHLQLNHARALIQDGIHIQANPAYLHLFGLHKPEQILGKLLIDVLQPQQHAEFEQHVQQLYLENRAWRHLHIHSLNPALKLAPELDIICIAQPDVTKLEIYILPTALLHTPPQLPNTQPIQPVQSSLSTATSPAVNDQYYDASRRFAPSAKAPARSQPSTPISALKQHDFDIARLDLACSEILNLAQSEQPKQSALKLYFQQLHSISRKNQPPPILLQSVL